MTVKPILVSHISSGAENFKREHGLAQSHSPLVGVQMLRGLAALLVVFHHYNGTAQTRGFGFSIFEHTVIGNIGVDIFFVISGFIMELTVRHSGSRRTDAGAFLIRRAIRVLPLYWILTIVAMLSSLAFGSAINRSIGWEEFLRSLLLLPTQGADGEGKYVISVAWSLSYEFYFYLLFAWMLSQGFSEFQRMRFLTCFFAVSVAAGIALKVQSALVRILVDPILFEFLAGCLLARLFKRNMIPSHAWGVLSAVAVGLMLVSAEQVIENGVRLFFWGLPAAMLVFGVVLSKGGRLLKLKVLSPLSFMGDISYSLYLSHFFAIALFVRIYPRWLKLMSVPDWLAAAGAFGLCIAIAIACYFLIEAPFRLQLSRSASSKRTAATTT